MDILSNKKVREHNSYVEGCTDWNQEMLKLALVLVQQDIINISSFFKLMGDFKWTLKLKAFLKHAEQLVLGKHLGIIPKHGGLIINGRCCLENVQSLLDSHGLHCTFLKNFYTYRVWHGECTVAPTCVRSLSPLRGGTWCPEPILPGIFCFRNLLARGSGPLTQQGLLGTFGFLGWSLFAWSGFLPSVPWTLGPSSGAPKMGLALQTQFCYEKPQKKQNKTKKFIIKKKN